MTGADEPGRNSGDASRAGQADRRVNSEAHWRGLFEGLSEGFMVGEAIRDGAGRVVDWRHLEANSAFQDVVGFPVADLLGKTIRELTPQMPSDWIDFVGRTLRQGNSHHFDRPVQRAGHSYDGRLYPIGGDQFAAIFVDVTDRVAAERRQAALIAIGDAIRDLDRIEDMITVILRTVGELLGVARTGFGRVDAVAETIDISSEWTAPGVASIMGVHRYADYGNLLLNELLAGEPLIMADILTDPRTAADPGPMLAVGVGAQVQMPMRERGRTVATFFVHQGEPREWSADELSFLREVADRLEIEVRRLEMDGSRRLQAQELSHRLKNTLAMVQAIAAQTLKHVAERAAVDNFDRRLTALSTAHDVLLTTDWDAAPLDTVIRSVLEVAGQDDRAQLSGPAVQLAPRAVLSVSLLIHELATNAVKYGALSVPVGTVSIDWSVWSRDGHPLLDFAWIERGGPSAKETASRGVGSRLIAMGLVGTGDVDLTYAETGFSARMSAPLDDLTTA